MSDPTIKEVSDGLHKQILSYHEEARRLIAQAKAEQAAEAQVISERIAQLNQSILDLDLKLQRYMNEDRYNITRAQVLRAMREANE